MGKCRSGASTQMQEIFHIIEPPRQCSYLADETATLEYRLIHRISAAEYGDLLARGYRRFGTQFFRPACGMCTACRSVRIVASRWEPSAGERRVLRRNSDLRAELKPLFANDEIVGLYNLYHRFMHGHRGWPSDLIESRSYRESFLEGPGYIGRQWLYYLGDQLVGVSLMDVVPKAVSLVYAFFHPGYRERSLGTFSILNQFRYSRDHQLDYAYLGYWVEDCQSLSYKGRFHPREVLRSYPAASETPVWEADPVTRFAPREKGVSG